MLQENSRRYLPLVAHTIASWDYYYFCTISWIGGGMNPCTIASSRREIEREIDFLNQTDKQRALMYPLNFFFDRMSTATTMEETTKTGETFYFFLFCSKISVYRFSMHDIS